MNDRRADRHRNRLHVNLVCLCAECGKNLNDEPHTHEEQHRDPRWAALDALRDEL